MKRYWNTALLIFLAISLSFCSSKNDMKNTKTLVLGHRATGRGVQDGFIENTLPAVKEALKYADGVEQDIQMSSDHTPWIYHDDEFDHLCGESVGIDSIWNCIPDTPDSVISAVRICRDGVEDRIYRLEELFELYQSYPDKYISLDVKGYFNEGCIAGRNVSAEYLENEANAIYELIDTYDLIDRIFVETNYTHLFEVLKSRDPRIRCTLLGYTDMDEKLRRSIKNHWDGVSFNLSDSTATPANGIAVEAANQLLQLWTIYSEEDYEDALRLHPTAVQVSDLNLMKTLYQNRNHPGG